MNRRQFLTAAAGVGVMGTAAYYAGNIPPRNRPALIAITLDLEMSRNFPQWTDTHWDYEKGNLNDETKRYTEEACRRVHRHGGVLHCFMLGRTLEQQNVDWLRRIARQGHPIGNHTYDHVNVKAQRLEEVQYRFRRAPWLVAGGEPRQVILDNIRMTTAAMRSRLEIGPAGFRTPGGYHNGLADRERLQRQLRDLGFSWVSSKYPRHQMSRPNIEPTQAVYQSIVQAQAAAQPYVYPSGLVEIPMSAVSDISAFRGGRWRLEWFLRAIRMAVEWTIENRGVFDFLGHPSCLYVKDPMFRTIELICDLVRRAGDRARIVSLDTIAENVRRRERPDSKKD